MDGADDRSTLVVSGDSGTNVLGTCSPSSVGSGAVGCVVGVVGCVVGVVGCVVGVVGCVVGVVGCVVGVVGCVVGAAGCGAVGCSASGCGVVGGSWSSGCGVTGCCGGASCAGELVACVSVCALAEDDTKSAIPAKIETLFNSDTLRSPPRTVDFQRPERTIVSAHTRCTAPRATSENSHTSSNAAATAMSVTPSPLKSPAATAEAYLASVPASAPASPTRAEPADP